MNGLVQGGKEKNQHEAVTESRKRQPVRADADVDEIPGRHQNTNMTSELCDSGGIGTLRQRSQPAREFGVFAHCLTDRSGHGCLRDDWDMYANMLSAARDEINRIRPARAERREGRRKAGLLHWSED